MVSLAKTSWLFLVVTSLISTVCSYSYGVNEFNKISNRLHKDNVDELNVYTELQTSITFIFLVMTVSFYTVELLIIPALNIIKHEKQLGRSLTFTNEVNLLQKVLKSIDPVELAFTLFNIDEVDCQKRTICEIQRTVSTSPLLGDFVKFISPSIKGLSKFEDAQEAGAALEDCALLFSDCPYSELQGHI